ncbi:hypothetical protein PO909_007293 [Leuciscus waleckii]
MSVVLSFLQEGLERRLSPSTLKVYVNAIAAHHDAVEGKSVGKHNLIIRFLRGARRLNPPCAPLVPSWDLSVGLTALQSAPFEPLQSVELKFLSIKTAVLVALTSIRRVGDLQVISIDEACLEFSPANSHVILRILAWICAQGSHHSLSRPGGEPASAALGGGRPSLGTALSSTCPLCLRRQNAVFQDLRPALCLLWWEAEGKGSLQAKVVSLDSGCHCFGIPAAWSTVPPWCDGPLHPECGLLLGSSAWRLANRHLQSCRLGDSQHICEILQSPSGASFYSCTRFKQLVLDSAQVSSLARHSSPRMGYVQYSLQVSLISPEFLQHC